MGKLIRLEHALESDPAPLKAPPAWANTEVGTVNGPVVLHAGGGGPLTAGPGEGILIAANERHRAAVPDGCLLLSVEGVAMKRFE